jgi:hypothetical protein
MKLETKVRKQVSDVKFIPAKMAEHPTMIGWIQYLDSGYRIKCIGLHTNGKGYWAQWPWWKTEKTGEILYYNKPESEEHQLILVSIFVEAMEKHMGATKKTVSPESEKHVIFEKVETKPKGQKPIVGDGVVFVPSHTRKWPNN